MTLFFGGNNANSRILTYNWTSQAYTSETAQLTKNRLFSACAVYKGKYKKKHYLQWGLLNVIMKDVLSLIILSLKGNSRQPDQSVDFM
jgi:hypothetical protein